MKKCCKKTNIALLVALMCVALLLCTACGKLTLSRPSGVYVDSDTLVLHWNNVNGANRYVVSVNDEEKLVAINEFSLDGLSAGDYSLKVRASEKDGKYNDSGWSAEIKFTREKENGLTYTLTNDKTAYKVSGLGTASGDIVVPDEYRGKKVTSVADNAFAGKSTVTSVTLGSNVSYIGTRAFYACSELVAVNLSEGLLGIGQNAFQSCKSLTEITLPDSLVTLGAEAFSYCSSLENVVFGSGLVDVGASAFYRCTSLTEVNLPDDTLFVGERAFDSCKALVSVNVGGAETLGNYAFYDCSSLTSYTGDNVRTLGMYAFGNCSSLASADLGKVTQIGDGAFNDCSSLADVALSVNTERIGSFAFYGTALWKQATDIVYVGTGGGVSQLWWAVGYKEDNIAHVLTSDDDTEGLTDYVLWRSMTVGIADQAFMKYNGKTPLGLEKLSYVHFPNTLRTIGAYAFYASSVQRVEFGESLTEVGEFAFAYCKKLYQLNVYGTFSAERAKLTDIGNYAFYSCEVLGRLDSDDTVFPQSLQRVGTRAFDKTAFFPSEGNKAVVVGGWAVGSVGTVSVLNLTQNVIGIADYAFFKDSSLTQVTLGEDVKYVGKGAFSRCATLQSVDASACKSLDSLGNSAFYKCTLLEEVLLPSALKNIGRSTFSGCSALVSVSFDGGGQTSQLQSINDYAFNECSSLQELVLPESVNSVGANAFAKCTELTAVTMSGLTSVGERAFKGCEKLTTVALGENLQEIGNRAFYGCVALADIQLPDSVTSIGNYAFYGCTSLSDVKLGNGLQKIGTHAFFGCISLTQIDLPTSLQSVGAQAFRGCSGLTSIVLRSNIDVDKHAFYGCDALTIYAEDQTRSDDWSALWNSSYRPVVWGCNLSDEGYVLSVRVTGETFTNVKNKTLSAPSRNGYDFAGWSDEPGATSAQYTVDSVVEAPVDTTLYTVWKVTDNSDDEQ